MRKKEWKVGDYFKLDPEQLIDTHLCGTIQEQTVFKIQTLGKSGVITNDIQYFLYSWIVPVRYLDTPLYKKLKGIE